MMVERQVLYDVARKMGDHLHRHQSRLLRGMWLSLMILIVFAGCRPVRQLVPVVVDREADQVLTSMHASQPVFDFFSARFSGRVTLNGMDTDIAGTIRIRKDSAIFISIAPVLGIEVARILVTPHHVRVLNRLESTYFEGDMQLINSMLRAELDYYMLQSLLLANDFPHFSSDNFRLSSDQDLLKLHSPARRRLRPAQTNTTSIQHSLWLNPQSYRITQAELTENEPQRTIRASYPTYATAQGQSMPSELLIAFTEELSQAQLAVRYSRITLDQPQQMTFNIPSRYRPMEF